MPLLVGGKTSFAPVKYVLLNQAYSGVTLKLTEPLIG